jgi:bifunctional non-homologous end joining protein LigD
MSDRIPFRVRPMLATLIHKPFNKSGWIYEEKYDGYRILAYKEGAHVILASRNAKDRTGIFSTVAQAVAKLPITTLLLDGEVVAVDRKGISRFQLLQRLESQPQFAVFDCLYQDGVDLRQKPLTVRRAALERVISGSLTLPGTIFCSAILASNGVQAFEVAKRRGYEGIIGKDATSPYIEGRSSKWLKVKVHQEDEFIIVGYTAPAGSRKYLGALLLGAYDRGNLRYLGKVGTGFSQESLARLFRTFQPLARSKPVVTNPPKEKAVTYLAPRLVAQIAYEELTADQKLRQPVFRGLRDDKDPRAVKVPEAK